LPGFGNVGIRQASQQADERRAAENCAREDLQHTTGSEKVSSLHADGLASLSCRRVTPMQPYPLDARRDALSGARVTKTMGRVGSPLQRHVTNQR
jgi:hypothetical protein